MAVASAFMNSYIGYGQVIEVLHNEDGRRCDRVLGDLKWFADLSDALGFTIPPASIDDFKKQIARFEESNSPDVVRKGIPTPLADCLRAIIRPIAELIYKDAQKRQTIVLNTDGVSKRLQELHTVLTLSDAQKRLRDEAARCLECEAYRSAAVMGWNLAYDYIRQWIFDKWLSDFNTALTTHFLIKKTGLAKYEPIQTYDDFLLPGAPGEADVLDTCKLANKIGGNVHDDLRGYLRQRNHYAHPSDRNPTANQINAYIEHLIDIITRHPFR